MGLGYPYVQSSIPVVRVDLSRGRYYFRQTCIDAVQR